MWQDRSVTSSRDIDLELERARKLLNLTQGERFDTLSIKSRSPAEASFLANNVSKMSPFIGNLIEALIPQMLSEKAKSTLEWRRRDPEFPDAGLYDTRGTFLDAGFEVKAWFPLATEMTGRFRESQNLLAGKKIDVVVVAWMLSDIIFGEPEIVDVLIVPAIEVAKSRDSKYHNPPDYLCEEPQDTSDRARNLQQSNVAGYKLQDRKKLAQLQEAVRKASSASRDSSTKAGIALTSKLQASAQYRLDTNFAKLSRVGNPAIEEFEERVLSRVFRGLRVDIWRSILRQIEEDTNKVPLPILDLYK